MTEPFPRIRVIDLETAGNGPHDVCEIGWPDVERGLDCVCRVGAQRGTRLVNPDRPISPDMSPAPVLEGRGARWLHFKAA